MENEHVVCIRGLSLGFRSDENTRFGDLVLFFYGVNKEKTHFFRFCRLFNYYTYQTEGLTSAKLSRDSIYYLENRIHQSS